MTLRGVVREPWVVRVLEVGHLSVRLEPAVRRVDATHPGQTHLFNCVFFVCVFFILTNNYFQQRKQWGAPNLPTFDTLQGPTPRITKPGMGYLGLQNNSVFFHFSLQRPSFF